MLPELQIYLWHKNWDGIDWKKQQQKTLPPDKRSMGVWTKATCFECAGLWYLFNPIPFTDSKVLSVCIALESKTPVTSQFPLISQTEFINMVHQRSFCVNIISVFMVDVVFSKLLSFIWFFFCLHDLFWWLWYWCFWYNNPLQIYSEYIISISLSAN